MALSQARRVRTLALIVVIATVVIAGCATSTYIVGQPVGIDMHSTADMEILGYVTTEIVQQETLTSDIFSENETRDFSFVGFRQNLLDAARQEYNNVDDVIRVVVTRTFNEQVTNYLFFENRMVGSPIYHVEGIAVRYR